ncbi:unnamed protein product [Vitrella brassicaformis CCMP3155]|uniref:Uncharacterized protein n=1 Tax=Vitrella brassicaformis (strain CCMP3155) TaxID=1169540 RepID=A0A0G4GJZ8_VITBC|nr:unnamed protein product [Vitrella brassicaformis CCMP3155]|eukprot:CEM30253.1 unnamed protein product [Vitrella brassicaformis CCMP3155]
MRLQELQSAVCAQDASSTSGCSSSSSSSSSNSDSRTATANTEEQQERAQLLAVGREMELLGQLSPEEQLDIYGKEREVNKGDAALDARLASRTQELTLQYQGVANTEEEDGEEDDDGQVPEWLDEPLPQHTSLPEEDGEEDDDGQVPEWLDEPLPQHTSLPLASQPQQQPQSFSR